MTNGDSGNMTTLPETLLAPPLTVLREGASRDLLSRCSDYGRRGLLVHGGSLERSGRLEDVLGKMPQGMDVETSEHSGGEPTLSQLEALLGAAREYRPEWIAAVGGGSVMDVAKACAGLLDAPLAPAEYHRGAPVPAATTPFVAVPTTAGTGSEATMVTVLTNSDTNVKRSFRHPSFMARLVILDPELLYDCPPAVLAGSGMDAFSQAVEPFVSRKATWITDSMAMEAARLISGALEQVFRGARGDHARDLLVGSYLAGLALSNARLGLVHGLAHPLGTRYHAPHGLVCGVCLPAVIEFNRGVAGDKYDRLSSALGDDVHTIAVRLLEALEITSPFAGREVSDRQGIIDETLASGSTAANPRDVTAEDVDAVLEHLFQA